MDFRKVYEELNDNQAYILQMAKTNNPTIEFHETSEFKVD